MIVIPGLYRLRVFPDPVLRMVAKPVVEFDEKGMRGNLYSLVGAMGMQMYENSGVGLAAPQVGIIQRVIVMRDRVAAQQGKQAGFGFVNPEIIDRSKEVETMQEGCLSMPGLQIPVERHTSILVRHHSTFGEELEIALEGAEARVIQHEIEHLDGVLVFDKLDAVVRRRAMASWVVAYRRAEMEQRLAEQQRLIQGAIYADDALTAGA
jgi:peptide deformylase